jgi:hypothetical protein
VPPATPTRPAVRHEGRCGDQQRSDDPQGRRQPVAERTGRLVLDERDAEQRVRRTENNQPLQQQKILASLRTPESPVDQEREQQRDTRVDRLEHKMRGRALSPELLLPPPHHDSRARQPEHQQPKRDAPPHPPNPVSHNH